MSFEKSAIGESASTVCARINGSVDLLLWHVLWGGASGSCRRLNQLATVNHLNVLIQITLLSEITLTKVAFKTFIARIEWRGIVVVVWRADVEAI